MYDTMNVSNILYTILYAGDTCAVLSGNDLSDLIKLLHTELCKLSIWLSSNNTITKYKQDILPSIPQSKKKTSQNRNGNEWFYY